MKRLGDLDANIVIMSLLDESKRFSLRAEPGMGNFEYNMAVSCVLGSLAIALHEAYKHAVENPS